MKRMGLGGGCVSTGEEEEKWLSFHLALTVLDFDVPENILSNLINLKKKIDVALWTSSSSVHIPATARESTVPLGVISDHDFEI